MAEAAALAEAEPEEIFRRDMKNRMKIEKETVRENFRKYTAAYDASDEKIALKIGHTYRVAELCKQIAESAGCGEADMELAWLLGMLHDIGRFEQLRRYDTFNDAESIDHAQLGADILFGKNGNKGCIREYIADAGQDALIETAIRVHSAYRVPDELDERTSLFCNILRDADKVDILRVNVETPLEEIYNTTREELLHADVTPTVVESFYEHHATLRSLKKTPVDHIVGHVSLLFELIFPKSLQIAQQQGYWKKLIAFPVENPETLATFRRLEAEMERFIENRMNGLCGKCL